jgi:transketolase
MRPSIRLAALSKLPSIFVWTHDSIGLGEDGPTHQAVEHTASLRLIPGMTVWRPCDTVETAQAWADAVERRDGPTCLVLSRQNAPFVKRSAEALAAVRRGGYVLSEAAGTARAAILATGTEVSIALAAQKSLSESGIAVRVVSMPSTSVFDRQDAAWRESVLPKGLPRVSIEAGVTDYWRKYVGLEGEAIGVDRFGESAPAPDVYKHLGVDVEHLVAAVRRVV